MRLGLAIEMAKRELEKHGLDSKGWVVDLNERRSCFGLCNYWKKKIYLSRYLVELNTAARVMNTIFHEVAHALVGPSNGHNGVWKEKAKALGCNGDRCYSSANTVTPTIARNYIYKCPKCGSRISKSYHMKQKRACVLCCNKYNNGVFSAEYAFQLVKEGE